MNLENTEIVSLPNYFFVELLKVTEDVGGMQKDVDEFAYFDCVQLPKTLNHSYIGLLINNQLIYVHLENFQDTILGLTGYIEIALHC